jgi:hypothetical protein
MPGPINRPTAAQNNGAQVGAFLGHIGSWLSLDNQRETMQHGTTRQRIEMGKNGVSQSG